MKQRTIIIIAISAMVACSVLTLLLFFIFIPKSPSVPAGKIGGQCIGGTDCEQGAECQYGECFEKCKAQPCWPCQNVNDIPRKRTYWCDYAECPQECEEEEATKTKMSSFIEEEQQRMREKEEERKRLAAEKAAKEAAAAAAAEAKTAEMQRLCDCKPTPADRNEVWFKVHPICAKGVHGADGSDYQKWCYTRGGEQCTTGKKTVHSNLRGMTWQYCE
jgi:hypothetical protein